MPGEARLWEHTSKQVPALLDDLDPYGLEPGRPDGAPTDEYRLEAEHIARGVLTEGGIDLKTVDEIWVEWFDETLLNAVGVTDAARLVERLNARGQPDAPMGDMP